MNTSAILITVIYINGIRQNGCHYIFFFSPYSCIIILKRSWRDEKYDGHIERIDRQVH